MFGGKKDKKNRFSSGGTTLLARSVEVLGNLRFAGHLEVEGRVKGNVDAEDDENARVRILDQGMVEGEIRAPNVIINGQVTGDVHATQHLELAAQAVVNGNVYYQVIEMVKGAQVNGNLVYVNASEPASLPGPSAGKKRAPAQDSAPATSDNT